MVERLSIKKITERGVSLLKQDILPSQSHFFLSWMHHGGQRMSHRPLSCNLLPGTENTWAHRYAKPQDLNTRSSRKSTVPSWAMALLRGSGEVLNHVILTLQGGNEGTSCGQRPTDRNCTPGHVMSWAVQISAGSHRETSANQW